MAYDEDGGGDDELPPHDHVPVLRMRAVDGGQPARRGVCIEEGAVVNFLVALLTHFTSVATVMLLLTIKT